MPMTRSLESANSLMRICRKPLIAGDAKALIRTRISRRRRQSAPTKISLEWQSVLRKCIRPIWRSLKRLSVDMSRRLKVKFSNLSPEEQIKAHQHIAQEATTIAGTAGSHNTSSAL